MQKDVALQKMTATTTASTSSCSSCANLVATAATTVATTAATIACNYCLQLLLATTIILLQLLKLLQLPVAECCKYGHCNHASRMASGFEWHQDQQVMPISRCHSNSLAIREGHNFGLRWTIWLIQSSLSTERDNPDRLSTSWKPQDQGTAREEAMQTSLL